MSSETRSIMSTLAFGVYVALQTLLSRYQGPVGWTILLAAVAGGALALSVRWLIQSVKS